MGRRLHIASFALFVACAPPGSAYAEMRRAPSMKPIDYPSPNGRFTVKTAQPFGFSVREGDKVLWSEPFEDISNAVVSDDGGTVVVTLWGWKDEGGSDSIVFYDGKGTRIGKDSFGGGRGSAGMGGMKWIRRLVLSPDGAFCALGQNGKEKSRVTLYDARKAVSLWERTFGLEEIEGIAFQPSGRNILIATRRRDTQDMVYLLVDARGEVAWEKRVAHNFTYDVKDLCRFSADGKQVEVYIEAEKKHIAFPVP